MNHLFKERERLEEPFRVMDEKETKIDITAPSEHFWSMFIMTMIYTAAVIGIGILFTR